MNVVGSNYIPVQANEVMPMAEGRSGADDGWQQVGSYVNWDSKNGVTGDGWQGLIDAPYSPFYNMDADQIVEHINECGNLNTYFSQIADLSNRQQDAFYDYLKGIYGYTEEFGCIGDKIF